MAYYRPIKSKDGKRVVAWAVQIFVGKDPATGKPRNTSKRFDTQKEAKEYATKIEGLKNHGLYRPTLSRATFADYLSKTWLPTYGTRVRSTYNTEKTLGKWILRPQRETPFLGGIPLRKLTVADFDRLYVAMAETHGIRRRGIEYLHGLLKRALKFAVKKGELPRNPADDATIPNPDVRAEVTPEDFEQDGPVRYLSREQAARFLVAAKQHRWSALWHLLLDAGLRPGEAFALKWAQVDDDAKLVHVGATLARAGLDKTQQKWKLTKPKTRRSDRRVPVSDATVAELRRWRKRQIEDRLLLGPEWQEHGFVFTTQWGTPLGYKTALEWGRVLRAADGGRGDLGTWGPEAVEEPRKPGRKPQRSFKPKFPLYILRHTSATLALLDGVDLLQVSRRLGHTDMAFTARMYGHMEAKHTTKAAESFDRLVSSVS
jgi:integrase